MTPTSTPPSTEGFYWAKLKLNHTTTPNEWLIVELKYLRTYPDGTHWGEVHLIGDEQDWSTQHFLWGPRILPPKEEPSP